MRDSGKTDPLLIIDHRQQGPHVFVLFPIVLEGSVPPEQLDEISHPPVRRWEGAVEIFQILPYAHDASGSML